MLPDLPRHHSHMTEETPDDVPAGFERLATSSPFIMTIGPFYQQRVADKVIVGLLVEKHNCNTGGSLHGGMFGALADIAIGNNIALALHTHAGGSAEDLPQDRPVARLTTVSMSTDFVGTAKVGDWIEVHVDVQKAGQTLAFANAYLMNGDVRVGRVSAVFRVLQ